MSGLAKANEDSKGDFMKNEILNRLNVVLNALNNVSVCGKANLANQSGSIALIEEVCSILADLEIVEPTKVEKE